MTKNKTCTGRLSAKDLAHVELNNEAYRKEVDGIKNKLRERKKSGYIKTFILSFRKAFKEARED
jgi:hypothetical protein